MKPKAGSPDARAIVAMLIRRKRKAWKQVEKDQKVWGSDEWVRSHRAYLELYYALCAARRTLYGQDK